MAGAAQQDWGFTEITRKFERRSRTAKRSSPSRRRGWTAVPARGAMHVGVWLVIIALLLLGLVGLRVSLLYKNMAFNDLIKDKNELRVENDRLSSDVSVLSSPERIEQIAVGPLGMVPSGNVKYVYISPSDNVQYADLGASASNTTTVASP